MEINSLSGLVPQDPNKKSNKGVESNKESAQIAKDTFIGPNTGELQNELKEMDSTNQELVDSVKQELKSGSYFTSERIGKTVEKLINHL